MHQYIKLSFVALLTTMTACKKLVDVPPPQASTSNQDIYSSDASAASVLTGIYTNLSQQNSSFTGLGGLYLYPCLSADELNLYDRNSPVYILYYQNALSGPDPNLAGGYWSTIYPIVFDANAAITGLTNNPALTPAVDSQLLGEAKFVRAFCYFYLVNFYGEVPLALSTDYTVNEHLPQSSVSQVYQQIIVDLTSAETLLSTDFLDATVTSTTDERVRPTSGAAAALLARAYLYTQKWDSAEIEATKVIGNTNFSLSALNDIFLANSQEAIWQWQPVAVQLTANSGEGALFVLPASGPNTDGTHPVYLSDYVLNSFESGDMRRSVWVDSVITGTDTFYFPFKYKQGRALGATTEYPTILRLGEQYLIRAEARAQQGKLADAASDLNMIRSRAGLPAVTSGVQADILAAIDHERQVELFTEGAHRWFDLKRLGLVDTVLGAPGNVCAQKGGHWSSFDQLYPIPSSELQANPALKQNNGY